MTRTARQMVLSAVVVIATLALVACGASSKHAASPSSAAAAASSSSGTTITIHNFSFAPSTLTAAEPERARSTSRVPAGDLSPAGFEAPLAKGMR